jgi:hypothetical protein
MVDLRKPHRDWRKHPPSIAAVAVLISLVLFLGGVWVSTFSTDLVPDLLFGAGTVVAGVFVVIYVFGLGDGDPRKGRYKSD